MTEAFTKAATTILSLSKSPVGQSAVYRTRLHLKELEDRARARVAGAQVRPAAAPSARLHAARLYCEASDARHSVALTAYRAAQERLAAAPEPKHGLVARLMGRPTAGAGMEALERDVASAREALIVAERAVIGAQSNLARVQKDEAAAHLQVVGSMEAERRAGLEMLAEVVMAQRLVRTCPPIVFSGTSFTAWAGGKIERKRRRGLRNPNAKNIWGIPVDFG